MIGQKAVVFELIAKGYSNDEIAEAIDVPSQYARNLRVEYNEVAGLARKPSIRSKPRLGTESRKAYDYMVANPDASLVEVADATGISRTIPSGVRARYLRNSQ